MAHLSQGSLAYAALTEITALRPGETVFVSGGAGGVGSMAGQIARLLGAGRVVGSTGSPAKAASTCCPSARRGGARHRTRAGTEAGGSSPAG
ncbi:hypothetical protein [Streptomyces tsukubensis]|uniref:hypothetical protein n=1 Tax=Streptomyces tsukubensis TaxID=83656 RepID=UPI00351D179D